ncbi:hypothetical protein BST92_03625 [Nonlabens arenilitoris]|uniref:HTH cro/C1-type domain-containing protein n=1 Tax=Nonlabens arenilitoris TaxID=1217969 RepID=A0A2S7U7W8_9FLAO|nr:helix-turn-helix transcriptional regulator [Nonlabens arenilitoris]PQJ31068.1 hypothetical protein BST92_03625 [Nonlabens arenilitoris]
MIAAHHLKDLRLKNNYTQEHLAINLGISQKSYSNIENGTKKITLDLVYEIAKFYEMDSIELLSVLFDATPKIINEIKSEKPGKDEMEIHHGINDKLQLELIKSLNSRIDDLQKIIKMKDEELNRLR